jgi:O-succinylbenzoate synthase
MDRVKINCVKIYGYSIPLIRPLQIKTKMVTLRTGFLLALTDENNHTGWGEIAPLPGLHRQTPNLTLRELKSLGRFLVEGDNRYPWKQLEHILIRSKVSPPVLFGTESALLNLKAIQHKVWLPALLHENYHRIIPVNALLLRNEPDPIRTVKKLLRDGYTTIKIKVGGKDRRGELDLLRCIAERVTGQLKLRLDANRAWTLGQAIGFIKEIKDLPIEYIEEPLQNPSQGGDLYSAVPCPIAVDESIPVVYNRKKKFPDWIKVLVIKPAVIGGINTTVRLIQQSAAQRIDCVISDTFHSGVGLSVTTALAAGIYGHRRAMGLDTIKWLKLDLLRKKFNIRHGRVYVNSIARNANDLRISRLGKLFTI